MLQIMIKRFSWRSGMPRNLRRATVLAILETAYAWEVSTYAAGKMRDQNLQGGDFIKQATVDEPHRRHHQGKFPSEHAPKVVRIHVRPAYQSRRRVDENIEPEIRGRPPKRA